MVSPLGSPRASSNQQNLKKLVDIQNPQSILGIMNATLNKDGTPRKRGSGRRKGANSFVSIRVSDLEQFCGKNTLIPISRVWLESMGASFTEAKQTKVSVSQASQEEEQKISYKVHNFVDSQS